MSDPIRVGQGREDHEISRQADRLAIICMAAAAIGLIFALFV